MLPLVQLVSVRCSKPSLQDNTGDIDRLKKNVAACSGPAPVVPYGAMATLATAFRQSGFAGHAVLNDCGSHCQLVDFLAEKPEIMPAVALDLGTTHLEASLLDLLTGEVLAQATIANGQIDYGTDILTRIHFAATPGGLATLQEAVIASINTLCAELCDKARVESGDIRALAVSGNTTMVHLLLQIEPRYLRRDPYIPTVSDFPILKAGEIGLKANPMAAVFVMPGPASYVGGDIVSGVLYTGFHREEPTTLFIDVGTNGEIVLGNKDWLMTAACSAGPAFEGGGIRWGMRAEDGAIEKVTIDPQTLAPDLSTVGDAPARGICGSGMIDLIAELLKTGIVDRSGQFSRELSNERVRKQGDEWAYVLTFADETPMEEDIVFTASDLKNLVYSKGAVYAGFTTLLGEAGMDFSMVDRMIITGGFGQYLNIEKAVTIGLLPDIDRSKFAYMGNSSIVGATMALLSTRYRQEARDICNNMTYVDFSSNPRYMDEFTSALFLPHTDLNAFPNVDTAAYSPIR